MLKEQYTIGDYEISKENFIELVSNFPQRSKMGKIVDILGPFEGKINSIYHFKTENGPDFIFRARISKAFRYESIIKEKILFPFLDRSISGTDDELGKKVEQLNDQKVGSHVFDHSSMPIRVQDLYHYDESLEKIPFIYAIYEYLEGESLYYALERDRKENPEKLKSSKYIEIFRKMGEVLGELHLIQFDGFYSDIRDIGKVSVKKSWKELFAEQISKELTETKKHQSIQSMLPRIDAFFEKYSNLVEDEEKAVLFHNDFQSQNILIDELDDSFKFKGLIDFDNWRIGPPAQDFVKIQYWTIQGVSVLNDAFFEGYLSIHNKYSKEDLQKRINIYKLLWFILVFNFEMDKISKNERNQSVDQRFPAAEKYLGEIEKVLTESGV